MILVEKKYIKELLSQVNMSTCNPMSTPMIATEKLSEFTRTSLSVDDTVK